VKAVFEEMTEALNRGETVELPFGKFEVKQHKRPPLRAWILNRVRVTYKKRKYIEFTPGEELLEGRFGVEDGLEAVPSMPGIEHGA